MSKKKAPQQFQVSVEHEGIRHSGYYTVEDKVITVFYQERIRLPMRQGVLFYQE